MAQLVRASPCHGEGREFESLLGRLHETFLSKSIKMLMRWEMHVLWDLSSAGRASALQAEGHRFEPCRSHFAIGLLLQVCRSGGTGRRPGLKIPWVVIPVPVRFRSAALSKMGETLKLQRFSYFLSIKIFLKSTLYFKDKGGFEV